MSKIITSAARAASTLTFIAVIAGCAAKHPAPVIESRPSQPPRPAPVVTEVKPAVPTVEPAPDAEKIYVVQKGDTLLSIALAHGLYYRDLALWNNIENPNVIKLGETLRLVPPGAMTSSASPASPTVTASQPRPGEPVATPLTISPMPTAPSSATPAAVNSDKMKIEPRGGRIPYSDAAYAKLSSEPATVAGTPSATSPSTSTSPGAIVAVPLPPTTVPVVPVTPAPPVATPPVPVAAASADIDWAWPIQPPPKGKVVGTFATTTNGLDISGAMNTPVLAAAGGTVIYAGSGIRGYGRLVIIKHSDTMLSAYAHNEKILVAENQTVKKGQKIAEMGNSDTDQVKLHFEIRRQGKPQDPAKFLPAL